MIPIRSVIICHSVELTWGSVVWDMLAFQYGTTFLVLISIQTSVSLFSSEVLQQQYVITYFDRSHVSHVLCCCYIIIGNIILCYFFSFFLLHPLHPCWNILAIDETDKGPINPPGFSAPLAPMLMYFCICTRIYISCWYDGDVYHTLFD